MTLEQLDAKLQLRSLLGAGMTDDAILDAILSIASEARYLEYFEDTTNARKLKATLSTINGISIRQQVYSWYKGLFPSEVTNHFSFGYIPSEWYNSDRINTILSLTDLGLVGFFAYRIGGYRNMVFPNNSTNYYRFVEDKHLAYIQKLSYKTENAPKIRDCLVKFFYGHSVPATEHSVASIKMSREEWIQQQLRKHVR